MRRGRRLRDGLDHRHQVRERFLRTVETDCFGLVPSRETAGCFRISRRDPDTRYNSALQKGRTDMPRGLKFSLTTAS